MLDSESVSFKLILLCASCDYELLRGSSVFCLFHNFMLSQNIYFLNTAEILHNLCAVSP